MNSTLKAALTSTDDLPEADQNRVAALISQFTAHLRDQQSLNQDMQDPAYRADVVAALKRGEADIAAGRMSSGADVLARSKARIKKLHD